MRRLSYTFLAGALIAAACTPEPAPPLIAGAPVPDAKPVARAQPAPQPLRPMPDSNVVTAAQSDLKALGYSTGKQGDATDPAFQKSVAAFQKDQGLTEDGLVTPALLEKIRQARAQLVRPAAIAGRDAVFLYSDGTTRRQSLGLLLAPPQGLASDAPANFLLPLKPGIQASFHLGLREKNGTFKPAVTVSCRAGQPVQADIPSAKVQAVSVICQEMGGSNSLQWQSLYSPMLDAVVRQESASGIRDLVAIRPLTGGWPSAARTGLEWALTHALDAPAEAAPVQWSSTAVTPHFEIRAAAALAGEEAGLAGDYAAQTCRRFDMIQSGARAIHYPGIACQNEQGVWFFPGSKTPLATAGMGAKSAALRGTR